MVEDISEDRKKILELRIKIEDYISKMNDIYTQFCQDNTDSEAYNELISSMQSCDEDLSDLLAKLGNLYESNSDIPTAAQCYAQALECTVRARFNVYSQEESPLIKLPLDLLQLREKKESQKSLPSLLE